MNELKWEDAYRYGKELTPIKDIPYLIGVGEDIINDEMENPYSKFRREYLRGVAETASELRKQNIQAAMAGSPASLVAALEGLKECKI